MICLSIMFNDGKNRLSWWFKFRNVISKLRSISHNLEIERGRHTRPRTPITDGLCPKCGVLEDKVYFLISCYLFTTERDILFSRITTMFSDFQKLANHEKCIFMLSGSRITNNCWQIYILLFSSTKLACLIWHSCNTHGYIYIYIYIYICT